LTLLYVLYVLDTAMVGFDVAVSTYLDKIAPQADMAPTLAMGSTVNHISGVLIPTIGGLLWAGFGHSATFLAGATIAVATLLYVVLLLKPAEVHLRSIQA
jgi:MFS family permease